MMSLWPGIINQISICVDDEAPREGSLPSDEEILSSPSVSGASSNDDEKDSSDDDDEDEDVALKPTETDQHDDQRASSSAASGLVEMLKNIVDKGWWAFLCVLWVFSVFV